MNKGILIAGTAAGFVVVVAGIGGGLLALNMESNNRESKNESQNTETTSLGEIKTENKTNGWNSADGSWYFYKNNEKQTEWLQDKGLWYYLGPDGQMRTGWIKNTDKWYYLNTNGSMATNTTIDGYYLNDSGLIEDTPATQKQNNTDNNKSSKANSNITIEEAENLISSNIDAKDKVFLINGHVDYVSEVTQNTNDWRSKKIYNYLGVKENMYEFKGNYNCAFFVCKESGTTYIFDDETGKMGSGIYLIKDGVRAETWRIGARNNDSYIKHSYNGEDWVTL